MDERMKLLLPKPKLRGIIDPRVLLQSVEEGHKLVDLRSLGFMPGIMGGRTNEGFHQAGDVITQTVDGRDLNELWAEYQRILASYNAARDAVMRVLTYNVTKVVEDVLQGGDSVNMEKASEFGLPRGVRPGVPEFFSLGYSFDWWDVGVQYTWAYLADAEQAQTDSTLNAVMEADNREVFTEVLRQIFNNATREATIKGQNYNVFALYNGDTTVPPKYKNTIHTAPHTHYLFSGAGVVDPGDLTGPGSMYDHLAHHGYSWQEGSALILMANSADTPAIRQFRVGVNGAEYDFITAQGMPDWAWTQSDLQNAIDRPRAAPPTSWNGLPVIGRYGPWLVIEEDLIPAGYLLGFASGGNLSAGNLVGFREHVNAAMRGLRLVRGPNPDYPLVESYYQRGFGTGVRQRGAGVVLKLGAAPYVVPAGLEWT